MDIKSIDDFKVAIIGLGYVGYPLAIEFAKKRPVIGFDLSRKRIKELRDGTDSTGEVSPEDIISAQSLQLTFDTSDLKSCNVYIITVPTPINTQNEPDLSFIRDASKIVGEVLSNGDYVIFESTVYPGVTEEFCGPMLERYSGLQSANEQTKNKNHFFLGYSPERVNPGDKEHRLTDIIKVTSGSTPEAARLVDELYSSIITAGTFRAESIKIAEAAKVIENTQRDVNIALMNEFSVIFNKLGINTQKVLEASSTKWNFLNFKPGLVGGHCIGIDPYYLIHKAREVGHNPELISCARRINDDMARQVSDSIVNSTQKTLGPPKNLKVLMLGATFKPDCPDVRNSKVFDLLLELKGKFDTINLFDPLVSGSTIPKIVQKYITMSPRNGKYDVIILTVPHATFLKSGYESLMKFGNSNALFFDIYSALSTDNVNYQL